MLEQIVINSKRTSDVIMEVAAAMREQSSSSQQIQASIEQLNQVTQENAAMVEELTSSCEALYAEAETLNKQVDFFKLEKEQSEADSQTDSRKSSKRLSSFNTAQKQQYFKEDNIDQF